MSNLDHGKFTRVTTLFHSLLGLDVFLLFFTGYAIMFNDELWWMLTLMGGASGVTAIHRITGIGLVALVIFWITLQVISSTGRSNFSKILPAKDDVDAFIQDIQFVLGRADERHPSARQFGGYKADEVPLLSYIGKGVVFIFSIELTLLAISGLLIWSKTGLAAMFQTKAAAMAFVTFHGLLGVIMLMGVMFHIFEHGMHPAFYPVETKAFIPRSMVPEHHGDDEEPDTTGIERLSLSPSWRTVSTIFGAMTVIGIVSVLIGSIFDEGYPVPRELAIGGGPASILLTIGINLGMVVLGVGLVLSMYGNVLRIRWEQQLERDERPAAADGGEPQTDGGQPEADDAESEH
ncbi:cytochrome b/b6 domain-containing protein [Haloarcula argentinensis]|uniref:Cytochrome b/b6 domain-containing protein n=1 Tax=Haloarcula argentinensis TaxID=43776 RepID=A0A847UKJ9_HALAR|nr:cytochrome b/b6 domain-containing protein [Haloarcula argentinensis]NLV12214.1 cytochrome b/b6 domain-containing protein [Haloarcula argentinensis]